MEENREQETPQDTAEQEAPEAPETEETESEEFDPKRAMEKIHKQNRENKALRKRIEELEPHAAKARELEEASKTELQRLQEAHDSAQQRATAAEAELRKLNAAFDRAPAGTDLERIKAVAKRATGDDDESLFADVDELYELLAPKPTPQSKPKERLRGGGTPAEPPEDMSPESLAARIPRNW